MSNKFMTKLRSLLLPPSDVPAVKCQIKDRVKCLATRFDAEGNEDAQGRKWSEVHVLREKTKWVHGTVMKKMGAKRFNGNYKVKCDGDNNSHTSNESHTFKPPPIGEELGDSEESDSRISGSEEEGKKPPKRGRSSSEEGNVDNALSDEERDAEDGMERPEMDNEDVGCPDQVTFELEDLPIGGTIDVKGSVWKRVTSLFRFGIIKVLICLFVSKKMLESEVSDRLSVNPKSVRIPTDLDRPIALHQLKEATATFKGDGLGLGISS
jgi:hypothetical protein